MSPPRRRRPAPDPFPEAGLAALGLAPGDVVRFRRSAAERWKQATVLRREKDGSVGLADARGASRAIAIDAIEVRGVGPRGGTVWEPLAERAARTEQLPLVRGTSASGPVADPGSSRAGRRRAGARSGPPDDPSERASGSGSAVASDGASGGASPSAPTGAAEQLPLL